MSTSTTAPCNLATALAEFQSAIPKIVNGERANTGTYAYTYASLDGISEAVLPLLSSVGLAWTCQEEFREIAGQVMYVLVGRLLHGASGEERESVFPLPMGASPQVIGSTITYGRRYMLTSMTGVTTGDDDNAQAAEQAVRRQHESQRQESRRAPRTQRPARQAAEQQETSRQEPKPTQALLSTQDALNAAVVAATREEIVAIWRNCDLDAPVRSSDYLALVSVGIEGATLRDVLKGIGEHVKNTGGPVSPLWSDNTEGA